MFYFDLFCFGGVLTLWSDGRPTKRGVITFGLLMAAVAVFVFGVLSYRDVAAPVEISKLENPQFEFLTPQGSYAADDKIPVQLQLIDRDLARKYTPLIEFTKFSSAEPLLCPITDDPSASKDRGIASVYVSCVKGYDKPIVVYAHIMGRVYTFSYHPLQ